MGCGSSKVSDVSQPVPVQAEGALNVKNEAAKSNAGINGGLKNEGNIELNDNTKLIDNDNAVNVDNSHDVNSHDVSGKGETALDNESKDDVEGRYVGKDGFVKDTDHTIVEKVKGGSTQKSKATYTTSKSKVKTTNDEGSIISKNKDEPANDKNITEETTTNSTTKQTGKGSIKEKRSISTDKSEEVDIKNIHKDKDVGLTDNAKEGNALETASTVKQNNSNKLASTKASVVSTNKNIPNANSTNNKDKVVADDTPKGKASGAASNKTTGQKSTNAKSSITSTTSSGPANSVKNTVAKGRKQRAEKRPVISQPKWRHDYDIPIVDPEEGLGALPEIYKGMEQPVKIEDTFWSGKRKVIPDFQVMRDIDKHTLAAPQNIKTNLKRLVQYLIKPAKNDVGKYRAIARWIGQNIDYDADVYFRGIKNSPSDPQSVLTKGSAVCAGYSKLFQAMCKEVSLDCEVITGKAKGVGYLPGSDNYENHAWNKIVIENEPYLCDVTWGAGGIGADKKFKRSWKEHEFLSEPVSFSQSRLPVDLQNNSEVNESAQLSEKPFKSLKTWADLPHYGSMLQAVGGTVSPNKGTIEAKANEGEIRITIPRLLQIYTKLKAKSQSTNMKGNHVMILWEDDTAVLRFALPGQGKYELSVIARFASAADKEIESLTGTIVTYCISATGTQSHPPFPVEHGYYGNNPYTFLKGYQCLSHDQPVISTSSYRFVMQFACPHWGKAFFRLLDSSKKKSKEETNIENCLYVEKLPNKYVCYIFLPKPGNYLLQQLTITEPGKEEYQVRATYIVTFKGKLPSIKAPFPKHTDWGTRKLFHDSRFKLMNIHGSTIHLNGGEGLLSFCRPSDCKKEILTNVVTMEDKVPPESREWAIITKDKITSDMEQVNVTLVLPKAGFYGLNLFIDRQFAGRFLISSDAKVTRSHQEKG